MTFNTGNNVPSTDPRDLYDNAENLDKLVNGVDPFYADRKGVLRESWAGMENSFTNAQEGRATAFDLAQTDKESRFQAFLVSSGYVSKGDYAASVVLAERNEYVAVDAATTGTTAGLYRPNAAATLPLPLTGTWATDSANLVLLGDDVLRQELAGNHGFELVGGAVGYVDSYESLRAYAGPATRLHVASRATKFDGGLGYFAVDPADTTTADNDGTILVDVSGRRWKRQFAGRVKAAWFGVTGGDLTQDYSSKVQAAVTAGCTSHGGVDFPAGHIRIDSTITFPNTAFDLHGATGTSTEFVTGVTGLAMLSFAGCNGPAKTVNRIGFGTTTAGSYNGVKGVTTGATNGLIFNYCWWRGLLSGIEYAGSFINLNFCVFEYNYTGINCTTACVETVWSATTHYKNEIDVKLIGDNTTFSSFGSNHIGTRTTCWDMTDCVGAQIYGVNAKNDGTAYTPDVIHFKGASTGNYVDGVGTTDFGRYAVFFEGPSVAENKVVGLDVRRSSVAAGTRGVFSSTGPRNVVEGRVYGCEYGVFFDSADGNQFRGRVKNCTTGVRLAAASDSVLSVDLAGNTSDAVSGSATTLYLERWNGDTSGFGSIPYVFRHYGFRREVYTDASPSALTWQVGDIAINRSPAVGAAKGWRCTVAGTPGTWVSDGNL